MEPALILRTSTILLALAAVGGIVMAGSSCRCPSGW